MRVVVLAAARGQHREGQVPGKALAERGARTRLTSRQFMGVEGREGSVWALVQNTKQQRQRNETSR